MYKMLHDKWALKFFHILVGKLIKHQTNVKYSYFVDRDVFQLRSFLFEGDNTGVLHVGPDQLVVIQHPDDLELLLNIYVYEGGTLVLPNDFICHNVEFFIW